MVLCSVLPAALQRSRTRVSAESLADEWTGVSELDRFNGAALV